MLGAEEFGDSVWVIFGSWKLGDLASRGRRTGDELPESVPEPKIVRND